MIVRYIDYLERLEFEIIQRREQGSNADTLDESYQQIKLEPEAKAQKQAYNVLSNLMADDKVVETELGIDMDDLESIHKSAPAFTDCNNRSSINDIELHDKLLGGWQGRAAGCLLGKPIERYMRPVLREMLQSNNNWPLDNYWTEEGMPQELLERYPWKQRLGWESLRENIVCMPEDDDLNYVMLNLHIMEKYGYDFNSNDVATAWLTNLPAFQVFTAERVAYLNLLNGLDAPESASYMNPFREWIGAQIRADLWGYISPANPAQAAELAWRDGRISHTSNGLYSEMFFAALIANAFVESDLRCLVEGALSYIPENSRFSQAINKVLVWPISTMSWESILDTIDNNFGTYHWVHSINNAVLTVAALLAGAGDYEKTICNTVMGGWDTDSNAATAGSIVGIIIGAKALPSKWITPLNNKIRSSVNGFDNSYFTDLADRTLVVSKQSKSNSLTSRMTSSDDF